MMKDIAFLLLCIAVLAVSLNQMLMSRRLRLTEDFIDSVVRIFEDHIDRVIEESEK